MILLMGALLTVKWWQEAQSDGRYHHACFFAWSIPLWLLMIGREISWGRVFYPMSIDATSAPYFIPVSQLPYGPIVYPVIAVVIVMWLFAVIKHKLYTVPYELFRQGRFPIGEFLLVIFSFIISDFAEKKLHSEVMEEMVECVAYLALILTVYGVKIALFGLNRIKNKSFFS